MALQQSRPGARRRPTGTLHLIYQISGQDRRQLVFEAFKRRFAIPAGEKYVRSKTEGWAATELEKLMDGAQGNEATFIEAFDAGCRDLVQRADGIDVPDEQVINGALRRLKGRATARARSSSATTSAPGPARSPHSRSGWRSPGSIEGPASRRARSNGARVRSERLAD